ncbi:MAG: hypothetical protein C7B45_08625 [Sulfobacillus acidophilus]|uniref:Uncharacterized protein n=1 Tax=Sulfobacillus acidophilus TaxID=53633 RepID=A0A2T2WI80_9FIRM|nr:MAG: hypothetical protein C7B45_08625 [Sulfobacillus acidophilus]
MAIQPGNSVFDPRVPDLKREGTVIHVLTNPACLMRTLIIQWHDEQGRIEEMEEIEFGPLED